MASVSLADIVNDLQGLLVRTFSRAELKQLLLTKMELNLDEIAPDATAKKELMFEVVLWMDRHGSVAELIGHAAAARGKVPQWAALVEKIKRKAGPRRKKIRRSEPAVVSNGAAVAAGAAAPVEVTALVRGYLRLTRMLPDGDKKTVQLQDLADQLLALPLADYELAELFHLSDCAGERLVAVLTLALNPDFRFLQWLSERLAVESQFVGYHAAVALRAAARTVPQVDLDIVAAAVESARVWIPEPQHRGGRWKMLGEALEVIIQRSASDSGIARSPVKRRLPL